ncbi:MAG: hypothetical protein RLQ12_17480 [Cyclobacteriaceae bacterium]
MIERDGSPVGEKGAARGNVGGYGVSKITVITSVKQGSDGNVMSLPAWRSHTMT